MARLEGFEPPTNRIGTCYSIQLSYRRTQEVFARRILPMRCLFAKAFSVQFACALLEEGQYRLFSSSSRSPCIMTSHCFLSSLYAKKA